MVVIDKPHTNSVNEVVKQLQSNISAGLDKEEVLIRLQKYGKNIIESQKPSSLFRIFLDQFISPLVWVLGVAAGLAFLFQEWLEAIAVIVVIFINSGIGFYMEAQAMRSMEALKKLSRTMTRVFRNGKLQLVSATEIVPGDIIYIEAGDMVPADCRLIEEYNLGVTEAALTGESIQVSKDTEVLEEELGLADRKNLIFKGTMATRGNARAIVVSTGKATQLGQIAQLTDIAEDQTTPLEKKLNILSQKLIGLTLVLALVILIIGVLQGRGWYLMLETAIALAIAAIPEGLPIVATIALARGMLRLAKQQVIVKKLSAVETLGETDVIFTDKTGTLTENQLQADSIEFEFGRTNIQFHSNKLKFQKSASSEIGNTFAFDQLQKIAALCNNATFSSNGKENPVGDPLEIALLKFALAAGTNLKSLQEHFPRIRELPFDSETKMMGTLHKSERGTDYLVCIKGAPEVVLNESDLVLTREGRIPLVDRKLWIRKADQLAGQGLRVLAFAYSEIEQPKEHFFQHLTLVGLIGFIDPPRDEIREAIQTCRNAGIRIVMATGDHPETARNIAHKITLTDRDEISVMSGKSWQKLAETEPSQLLQLMQTDVFARVSPGQKLDLVKLYQDQGKTVGMLGDGVNDSPALKKADIGIAMGLRGTEAAKEVADLVLKDDAFTSIVEAIKQGRGIFENIRHFVVYLLSCNLSELLIVATAFILNLAIPLLPLQILFLNMVTDVFPAFALGVNKESEKVMEQPPRSKSVPIISKAMWLAIGIYAIGITIASLGALLFASLYLETNAVLANNFAYYTLMLAQLWNIFNLPEANRSFFFNEVTRNIYIWLAILASLLIMVFAYFTPILREVLGLVEFNLTYVGYVFLFSLIPIVLIQFFKRLQFIR